MNGTNIGFEGPRLQGLRTRWKHFAAMGWMPRTGSTWTRLVFALRGGACLNGIAEENTARGFHLLLSCALIWLLLLLVVVVPFFTVRPRAAALASIVVVAATLSA